MKNSDKPGLVHAPRNPSTQNGGSRVQGYRKLSQIKGGKQGRREEGKKGRRGEGRKGEGSGERSLTWFPSLLALMGKELAQEPEESGLGSNANHLDSPKVRFPVSK